MLLPTLNTTAHTLADTRQIEQPSYTCCLLVHRPWVYSLYLTGWLIFLPLRVNTADGSGAAAGEGAAGLLTVGDAVLFTGALTGVLAGVLTEVLTGVGVLSATGESVFSVNCCCGEFLMLTLFLLIILPVGVSIRYDLGS